LLAVASLSRVVEWWEAEKQFWNFNDNEDEQDEPLMFVTKPAEEPGSLPSDIADSDVDGFKLNPEEDTRGRPPTPPTITRKFRDEPRLPGPTPSKLAPPVVGPLTLTSPSKIIQAAESARVLATERLRLQAETAQNQNIVMELSLDGDHFIWVNHAWLVVVGYASIFWTLFLTV
jgi:serine/threonine-protein kinase RIM15